MIHKVPVLGFPVAAATREQAVAQISQWAAAKDRAYAIAAADVHVIARAAHDPHYAEVIRRFDLILPDGMPLLWEINGRLERSRRLKERVSGADLMHLTLTQAALPEQAENAVHFLLGGSESLLRDLEVLFSEKYPHARLGGCYSPPFGDWPEDEIERIKARIIESGAQHIWVGLGCPKQERWIAKHLDHLPSGVYYAVGAAFAFLAGHIQRAPHILQRSGLEWAYRLYREPKRLWKRYLTYNTRYIYYWLRHRYKNANH